MFMKARAAWQAATPNWTNWKTAKLALTVIGGLATTFATTSAFDALGPSVVATVHTVATDIGQIDTVALSVVIALSATSAGPTIARKES